MGGAGQLGSRGSGYEGLYELGEGYECNHCLILDINNMSHLFVQLSPDSSLYLYPQLVTYDVSEVHNIPATVSEVQPRQVLT